MNLPELQGASLHSLLQQSDLREKLVHQIAKDLESCGLELNLAEARTLTYDSLLHNLDGLVKPLFVGSSQKLFSLLYRIDISEKDLAKAGLELNDYTHSEIISHVIIVRELKKILIREYYTNEGSH